VNGPSATPEPRRVSHGTWGGAGIRIEVTEQGAEVELDCAHGTIRARLDLDSAGDFSAAGVFVREHPGPVREGHEPKEQPATYSGSLREGVLTLRIRVTETGETVGSFSLTHGSEGRVRKCR
jgi:hypothetical protein